MNKTNRTRFHQHPHYISALLRFDSTTHTLCVDMTWGMESTASASPTSHIQPATVLYAVVPCAELRLILRNRQFQSSEAIRHGEISERGREYGEPHLWKAAPRVVPHGQIHNGRRGNR
ncbi:hypothetical protein M758_UG033600 [Ceratodon purpureus]|nr:hypothetical protein M758_UG033600 [Ceratodon purpureus]